MSKVQDQWQEHYAAVPETLRSLREVETVVSVFNTNIDAVKSSAAVKSTTEVSITTVAFRGSSELTISGTRSYAGSTS